MHSKKKKKFPSLEYRLKKNTQEMDKSGKANKKRGAECVKEE